MSKRLHEDGLDTIHDTKKIKYNSDESSPKSNHSSHYDGENEYQKQVTKYYSQVYEEQQAVEIIEISDSDELSETASISCDESGICFDDSRDTLNYEFDELDDSHDVRDKKDAFDENSKRSPQIRKENFKVKIEFGYCTTKPGANVESRIVVSTEEAQLKGANFSHLVKCLPGETVNLKGHVVDIAEPHFILHGELHVEVQEIIIKDDFDKKVKLFFWDKDILRYQYLLKKGELISISNGKMGISSENFEIYVTSCTVIKTHKDDSSIVV
ncbi:hypothetical protein QAD02_017513 [Eretmocerus hayati]|uniref:Uncharacterized protein n=2 Tax=Eretmocerus hayati TaxID=131215 RepID=A0ACC2PFC4_9HYME|nr:hypothetical protein QAD02_005357 [Eretmocerus hayati]KAJ8681721.1 hypothetical protein QAD02_017513 [Eretmocerus hayati]